MYLSIVLDIRFICIFLIIFIAQQVKVGRFALLVETLKSEDKLQYMYISYLSTRWHCKRVDKKITSEIAAKFATVNIGSPNLLDNLNARNFSAIYQHGAIMYNYTPRWQIAEEYFAFKLSHKFGYAVNGLLINKRFPLTGFELARTDKHQEQPGTFIFWLFIYPQKISVIMLNDLQSVIWAAIPSLLSCWNLFRCS